jgi:hypothetical protein
LEWKVCRAEVSYSNASCFSPERRSLIPVKGGVPVGYPSQLSDPMTVLTVRRSVASDLICQPGFLLRVDGCCGDPSSTQRGRMRLLNRILEAAKMRREPKRALSEQNERWGAVFGTGGEALQNIEGM